MTALGAASALVAGLIAATPASAASEEPSLDVPHVSATDAAATKYRDGGYIVLLKGEPAATYTGGVSGISRTKPRTGAQLDATNATVQKYTDYLSGRQDSLASQVGVEATYHYTLAVNGFAAKLTASQAARLAKSAAVDKVVPSELLKPQADPQPNTMDFLGLSGDGGVWEDLGGIEAAGEGVVIGVLDTGIAPENPFFAGDPLSETASETEPYIDRDQIVFEKSDGGEFRSPIVDVRRQQWDSETALSTKIIGAQYFVDGFGRDFVGSQDDGVDEWLSPRDGDSHGSHTASTAAGNSGVTAVINDIESPGLSGVAPAAKIAAYKICWSGAYPTLDADDGCATEDIVAGIEAATADGVDVINMSVGGGAATSTVDVIDEAFFGAAAAGIFVAVSAGNSGPGSVTLDHGSPWYTTVAASTWPGFKGTVELGDGAQYVGASSTVNEDLTGDVVLAEDIPAAGFSAEDAKLCLLQSDVDPDLPRITTLNPALADGKIVVCDRGGNARVDKSLTVADAGGIGMIEINTPTGAADTVADSHSVPSIHLPASAYDAVYSYVTETADPTATLKPGNLTDTVIPSPVVADFSSRGPVEAGGSDILKPDVAAPGVDVLAAAANPEGEDPAFTILSGTSMASPHVAGLGALYLSASPDASPAEIKSALMTTAYDTLDNDGAAVKDVFAQGAGQVQPTEFLDPGLLFLNGPSDWLAYIQGTGQVDLGIDPIDPSDLNIASIAIGDLVTTQSVTRTLTATEPGTYTAEVEGVEGVDVTVEPSTLEFAEAGDEMTVTVTFDPTTAPMDEFATGYLTFASEAKDVRIPIAVRPSTVVVDEALVGEGTHGSVEVPFTAGFNGELTFPTLGLAAPVVEDFGPYDDETLDPQYEEAAGLFEWTDSTEFVRLSAGPAEPAFGDDVDILGVYECIPSDVSVCAALGGLVGDKLTGAATETMDFTDLEPGYYVYFVDIFAIGETGEIQLTGTTWTIDDAASAGDLTITPASIDVEEAGEYAYEASWSGLEPDTEYLGIIGYNDSSITSFLTVDSGEQLAPLNVTKPTISGTPRQGQTLTANPGTWEYPSDQLTFSYQWYRGTTPITGATGKTYRVVTADATRGLKVQVRAQRGDGPSGTATSGYTTITVPTTTSFTVRDSGSIHKGDKIVLNVTVKSSLSTVVPTGTLTITSGSAKQTVKLYSSNKGKRTFSLSTAFTKTTGTKTIKVSFDGAGAVLDSSASKSVRVRS